MKKLIPIILFLAIAGGGAYYYYSSNQVVEKPTVNYATVSQGDITEVVQATGSLAATRVYNVGSQVSGTVRNVYADYNSVVTKGKLLAEIDPTLLQVQVDLQMANVERQKGEIAIQEVQLDDARKQLERTRISAEKGLVTQQQLDASILTVKQRETSLEAAKKQLLTTQANLDQAKLNVEYTKIYAPDDGVIVERVVDPGQFVQSSMTAPNFFRIATDLRTLRLSGGVDEAEIGKVRRGQRVLFTVETYGPNVTFEGEVEAVRLNASTQNNVVTYPVWISVPNPDLRLKPSMTANIRIVVQTATNVVRIPNTALRFRPSNDVYTALGLTPPAPGQGRGLGAAPGADGRGGAAPGAAPAAGTTSAAAPSAAAPRGDGSASAAQGRAALEGGQQRQGGQAAQGRGGQAGMAGPGGRGGANGGRFANMSPEERERMMAQFGGRNGGRNGGPGGRGGRGANATAPATDMTGAERIDDLVPPVPTRPTPGQVWTWDEAGKKLEAHRITLGITDGQFSQMVTGDLKVGQQVVSNIIVPLTAAQRAQQQQSIFGNQQGGRGGFGGPQPGGGGGNPGGGGGQRGGGGGGGGRGGF
jgi:HlyD family secretion protein